MWWNPINSIRHELDLTSGKKSKKTADTNTEIDMDTTDSSNVNESEASPVAEEPEPLKWSKQWKFACVCKETCSYYEAPRYHPVGKMFECTQCNIWSHVDCVLGDMPEEEIEELPV